MSKPCSKTYAWFAKPNSGEYRKIERTAHEQERDCFALYAGITVRSTDERFSGGYKFSYHNLLDRDLNYPEGGKYTIRKREINLISTKRIGGNYNAKINGRWYGLGDTFMEQLYINAVRKAADYLKKNNIKAKVGNISDPANAHHSLFVQWCDDCNNGCDYDREVYNKIIKEVTAYHEEAYLKSDKQNNHAAQLIETFEKHQQMRIEEASQDEEEIELLLEYEKRVREAVLKLQKENKKLKEEKDEYLLAIGKLMHHLCSSDEEKLKKFVENNTETAALAFATLWSSCKK